MPRQKIGNRNKRVRCSDPNCLNKPNGHQVNRVHIRSDNFRSGIHKNCRDPIPCDCQICFTPIEPALSEENVILDQNQQISQSEINQQVQIPIIEKAIMQKEKFKIGKANDDDILGSGVDFLLKRAQIESYYKPIPHKKLLHWKKNYLRVGISHHFIKPEVKNTRNLQFYLKPGKMEKSRITYNKLYARRNLMVDINYQMRIGHKHRENVIKSEMNAFRGKVRNIQPEGLLYEDSSEITEDEATTRENIRIFAGVSKIKDNSESLMNRMSNIFVQKMRTIFDIQCHCEKCLKFCEPPDDAKVRGKDMSHKRVDLDDPWMMHMGCEVSKYLDSMVQLPGNNTVFDQNFNQRKPLELKNRNVNSQLNELLDQYNRQYQFLKLSLPQNGDKQKALKKSNNEKHNRVRSILRNHFKEFDLTEEQFDWLNGKLQVTTGTYNILFQIYNKAKRKSLYLINKQRKKL